MFGRWSALDIVLAIITGSSLSRARTGSAPLWGTPVGRYVVEITEGDRTQRRAVTVHNGGTARAVFVFDGA